MLSFLMCFFYLPWDQSRHILVRNQVHGVVTARTGGTTTEVIWVNNLAPRSYFSVVLDNRLLRDVDTITLGQKTRPSLGLS